jgi:hypothetical protein
MATKVYQEDGNLLSREESLEHASLAAAQGVVEGLAGLETWQKARIRKRPVTIYDINGLPLFLDYTIVRSGEVVGTARTAASRVLGTPVVSYIVGKNTWDYEAAVEQLTPQVQRDYPTWKIRGAKLVCYSYPKLGVMFEMTDDQGQPARLIFDVADYTLIPESAREAGEREGSYAWSFYGSLPEDERRRRLDLYNQFDGLRTQRAADGRALLRTETSIAKLAAMEAARWSIVFNRQLQFCTHYTATEARSHHCFSLHAQQKNDYCAVATCQMILCYYRYYYSQDQIAPALGYSPGGGCPSDQSPGYESLSCNHLDATFDTSPTWEEASTQITALHPMKSGISGHARACAGVSSIISLPGGVSSKKLYIYDPWPWNADYKLGGSVYWESWQAITHTNFVFTRLRCPN